MSFRSWSSRGTSGVHVRRRGAWLLGAAVLLGLAVFLGAGSAQPAYAATTIPVDCTADASALGSALASAGDGDTLAIQGTCQGTFDIAHSVTLIGATGATLDGQGAGTVLTVDVGKTVAVNYLTITDGHGTVGGFSSAGGIVNNGALTLTNSTVSGNSASVAQFHNGVGGIFNLGGNLTLTSSTVSGNSAVASASSSTAVGGITNLFGVVALTSSTVSGNSTGGTPSDAFGGILNSGTGVVTLTNSTVSGNSASAPGGVSAFSSAVGGVSNSGGSLTLTSSTLSGNSVSEPNGGFLPPVGGISNFFGGTLTVENSLIAGQSGGPNCFGLGASSDAGYNLDDGTSCGFNSANHSLPSTDPLLDSAGLKDNGGPTQTIALLPGSPAIDAIPNGVNGCGTTITSDQRGVSRPRGSGCDIGAFEFVVATLTVAIDIKPGEFLNAINPGSKGTIPVAILSTSGFNAPSQVDTAFLKFGRMGNESSLAFCSPPQDVNGDGLLDLLCHFNTQQTGFQSGDTHGVLTGKTVGGTPIRGTDAVVIVPPK